MRPTTETIKMGFRFVHFRLDEMQGSFDGTRQLAMAAWDMANPNHPPSQLDAIENLTTEEMDSVWCQQHGWKQNELEHWRQTGDTPKGDSVEMFIESLEN